MSDLPWFVPALACALLLVVPGALAYLGWPVLIRRAVERCRPPDALFGVLWIGLAGCGAIGYLALQDPAAEAGWATLLLLPTLLCLGIGALSLRGLPPRLLPGWWTRRKDPWTPR